MSLCLFNFLLCSPLCGSCPTLIVFTCALLTLVYLSLQLPFVFSSSVLLPFVWSCPTMVSEPCVASLWFLSFCFFFPVLCYSSFICILFINLCFMFPSGFVDLLDSVYKTIWDTQWRQRRWEDGGGHLGRLLSCFAVFWWHYSLLRRNVSLTCVLYEMSHDTKLEKCKHFVFWFH